ncbi:glycine cleavage system aminomethyltransferase GcvT [bacterium]|nr:glycine cleavage system aminomethyltransferase GcvT [bacterium]
MTKQTFLHDKHVALGARMVDFAGWHMPVQYTSIIEEHKTVREAVGIFDVSHMGEVFVSGKDSLKFLNKIVPQDISKLQYEKAVYCQLPNKNGGLIDDLIIYKLGLEDYLIICNASRVDEDVNWMSLNAKGLDVKIDNQSHNYSLLAIQGPKAAEFLATLGLNVNQNSFSIKPAIVAGIKLYASRTGYTGEDGFELMVENDYVEELFDKIMDAGKAFGIKPIGLGARDTLRLEAALHLYGNDLDENTTPIEAGLSWSVPKDKDADYNGKDVIMNQVKNGVEKKLVALQMLDKNIARHGYDVYYNGEKIGVVTSGAVSPTLGVNIALAYVKNLENICIDSVVQVMIREKLHDAKIVKKPFVTKRNIVKI